MRRHAAADVRRRGEVIGRAGDSAGRLELPGQALLGGGEIAHRQRPMQVDPVRQDLSGGLQCGGASGEPQPCQGHIVAVQRRGELQPAVVAHQRTGLGLPAGDPHRAIGGERGGVAVHCRMQVQRQAGPPRWGE